MISVHIGFDLGALLESAVQNLEAERVEDFLLDHSLERPGAISRVVALSG
jgi:hypothetical protein